MDFVEPPPPPTSYVGLKVFIIIAIILFFLYEFREQIEQMSILMSTLKQFSSMMYTLGTSVSTKNNAIPTSTPIDNKNDLKKIPTSISKKIVDKLTPKPKYKNIPQPDKATSPIQSQGNHCYIGEWKGTRTCYKVDNQSECSSGQLYNTEEHCRHPELR